MYFIESIISNCQIDMYCIEKSMHTVHQLNDNIECKKDNNKIEAIILNIYSFYRAAFVFFCLFNCV